MIKSLLNIMHGSCSGNKGLLSTAGGQNGRRCRARTAWMAAAGCLLFSLLITSASGQDSPSVKSSIDKTHILIGEPFRFSIDISFPTGAAFQLPRPDTIPHFEFLGKETVDSLVSGAKSSYHLEWKLTSFDSGINEIPAFPVIIGDRRFRSDSLLVNVSFGNLDSLKEYHDIRGIIDKENPAVKYIIWAVLALTLLGIGLFIWSASRPVIREPAGEVAVQKSSLSPLDEALASLNALKKTAPADAPSVKKYYSGMNDVLRIFLNRSTGLPSMVRTNEELILQMSRMNLDKEAFSHLAAVLRMSDFVKFAKYMPDVYDNERNLETMRSSIIIINETRK